MVCNGDSDCPNGEDEIKCDTLTCIGLLRCTLDNLCVHPKQVCDGVVHCSRSEDDERICDMFICPGSCLCIGYVVHCRKILPNINDYSSNTKGLILRKFIITNKYTLIKASKMLHLDLSTCLFEVSTLHRNLIKKLRRLHVLLIKFCELIVIERHSFQDLRNLMYLDLIGNHIVHLNTNTWNTFYNLPYLDFNHNHLISIEPLAFLGLMKLKLLNLSYNQILKIERNTFHGMSELLYLDISNNPILHIGPETLNQLNSLMLVSDILICCYISNPHLCINDGSNVEFTRALQCNAIFTTQFAQNANGFVGLILLLVHICNIIYNYKVTTHKTHMLLITHLYVSDSLFVLYVLGMSSVSAIYSSDYLYMQTILKNTYFCHTMNALLLCGGLLSKLTTCVIAINQLVGTKYALTTWRLSKYHLLVLLICLWVSVGLYARFFVMTKQSVYIITCNLYSKRNIVNSYISLIHWVYVVVVALLTIITAFILQQIISHVKKSSSRVRSTRDASKVYKKLAKHALLRTIVELATFSASCYLLVHSCFHDDKPNRTAVLYVAYLQASVHVCVYSVFPLARRGIRMIMMLLAPTRR